VKRLERRPCVASQIDYVTYVVEGDGAKIFAAVCKSRR
jgi:hypothetical protein